MSQDHDFTSTQEPEPTGRFGATSQVKVRQAIEARRAGIVETLHGLEGRPLAIELRDGRELRGHLEGVDAVELSLAGGVSLPVAAVRSVAATA
jgi:hypothetical protein